MAAVSSTSTSVGWQVFDACVVQTPAYSDPLDYQTFNWMLLSDAAPLAAAIAERADAAGYVHSIVTPTAGSTGVDLAATWAAMQDVFVTAGGADSAVSNAVPFEWNNPLVDYTSWIQHFESASKTGDAAFKAFCLSAGLTDGAGKWGFRYATERKPDGTPDVQYPNSSRACTIGDYFDVPELLDDIILAAEAIEFVKWHESDSSSAGRKFEWGAFATDETGAGDSSEWNGGFDGSNLDAIFDEALDDFETSRSPEIGSSPSGIATTISVLEVSNSTSDIDVTLSSFLELNGVAFEPAIDGSYKVHVMAMTHLFADSFSALGSGLADDQWEVGVEGVAVGGQVAQSNDVGGSMGSGNFPEAEVPSFSVNVQVSVTQSSQFGPTDVTGTLVADIEGEDVTNNGHLWIQWDLDGDNLGQSTTENIYGLWPPTNSYPAYFTLQATVRMYPDTVSEESDSDSSTFEVWSNS